MINADLTVITVTCNNPMGLTKTLNSLLEVQTKPSAIIIKDGGHGDISADLLSKYLQYINIIYIKSADFGIYDGMNTAKKLVQTNFIHYLNAGDLVIGDPYQDVIGECIIPVKIYCDGKFLVNAKYNIFKLSYCHQGIVIQSSHELFDTRYKICSDFLLLLRHFGSKLSSIQTVSTGFVCYDYSGVSSRKKFTRDLEILSILFTNNKKFLAGIFFFIFMLKSTIPFKLQVYLKKLLKI